MFFVRLNVGGTSEKKALGGESRDPLRLKVGWRRSDWHVFAGLQKRKRYANGEVEEGRNDLLFSDQGGICHLSSQNPRKGPPGSGLK